MSVIRDYRKKRKLTQTEFAEKIKVKRITISRWENKETVPTLKQAHDICNELRLPFMKLFNDYKKEE